MVVTTPSVAANEWAHQGRRKSVDGRGTMWTTDTRRATDTPNRRHDPRRWIRGVQSPANEVGPVVDLPGHAGERGRSAGRSTAAAAFLRRPSIVSRTPRTAVE